MQLKHLLFNYIFCSSHLCFWSRFCKVRFFVSYRNIYLLQFSFVFWIKILQS